MREASYLPSITLAGVVDEGEIDMSSRILTPFTDSTLWSNANQLRRGECEVHIQPTYYPNIPEEVQNLCNRLHLSFMWYASSTSALPGNLHIRDLELGVEATFDEFEHGLVDAATVHSVDAAKIRYDEASAILGRWPAADNAPPLHIVTSNHHALRLAGADSDQPRSGRAYLERRGARSPGR